ncbi:MAG: hypothetical protein WBP79_09100 [Candidatus Acidiferrales bacterium]
MGSLQCPFCGRSVHQLMKQCPSCREALPQAAHPVIVEARVEDSGGGKIRRGLLCMLLAAVVGYFSGGYSALKIPYPFDPIVTTYLSPLLFLSGLGLTFHGLYLQHKSGSHTRHSAHSS